MKRKVWIVALLAAALVGALVVAASFFFADGAVRLKERVTATRPEGCIGGFAAPASFGHFVADLIEYRITVVYCEGITVNTEQLLKEVDLSPFEIVEDISVIQRSFSNGMYEVVLVYTLQAIDVYPGQEYAFPDIPVEYSQAGKVEGGVYRIKDIAPIYISKLTLIEPLLEGRKAEFQPIKGEIAPKRVALLKKIAVAVGGIVIVLGVVEIIYSVKPKRAAPKSDKVSYREEIFRNLERIKSQANGNARLALHKLYNLVLELSLDASMRQNQKGIFEKIGEEIAHVAYGRDEPTYENTIEQIRKLQESMPNERGGD